MKTFSCILLSAKRKLCSGLAKECGVSTLLMLIFARFLLSSLSFLRLGSLEYQLNFCSKTNWVSCCLSKEDIASNSFRIEEINGNSYQDFQEHMNIPGIFDKSSIILC